MNEEHPKVKYGKTGVILVNLGTPDSTKWLDIRRYLKEFLSDKRVIEVNPFLWQLILNIFILNFRPSKTAEAYKKIWMKKENISPLRHYTVRQSEELNTRQQRCVRAKNNRTIKLSNDLPTNQTNKRSNNRTIKHLNNQLTCCPSPY